MRKLLLSITAFAALVALPAQSQDGLPDFGEGNAVSLNQEYMLGRAWLMQFRRQAPLLADPLLQDYIEELIFRLAQTSQLRERRLEVVMVDNATINAFAVPGGVVGVHGGLLLAAENEAQVASVLGHELAHLSQRHFSRSRENAAVTQKKALLGMLGGLVAAAAGAVVMLALLRWPARRQQPRASHCATAASTSRRRTGSACKTWWRRATIPTPRPECSR
ncbi:M48 family metalloprotease [Halioglobus japonicus]|uniref:M48 family metalloprotease n=1 Tax=Halioglobus japonicus TaxID=930805 RepID=UPI0009FD872E|nr:M48 family metalloprotease [Halioglobus japonicus]